MFGLLKKKIKGFTDKVFGKSQEKVEEVKTKEELETKIQKVEEVKKQENLETQDVERPQETKMPKTLEKDLPIKDVKSELKDTILDEKVIDKEFRELEKPVEKIKEDIPNKEEFFKKPIFKKEESFEKKIEPEKEIEKIISKPQTSSEPKIIKETLRVEEKAPAGTSLSKRDLETVTRKIEDDSSSSKEYQDLTREQKEIKTRNVSKLKSIFSSKIKLSEKEITDFLEDFEFSLLEADVSIDSASAIISSLKENLTKSSFSKNNLLEDIKTEIKKALLNLLDVDCDINNYLPKESLQGPLIVLIIGPNGAGKTTTIAKLANKFKKENKSVVLSSSDTFRAGSIDQLEIHSQRLGVKIIKQKYGSDPAAVAFDSVASAKAHGNDVVLIDTAGRQDTNINLMQELSKIKRVVKPHLTIYIAESQSGQAIVEQIEKFDKEIGVTGVILTKLDTDPKGGTAISILHDLKKPIFYVGTGQEYDNLEEFSSKYILERII
ncbi:signal recognition particle-docking protein FtsY [archaeon]|nr:signal recognition particle-docking protein FtsY [archaeon]MDD2477960.1 signal recognition particle-docking protein FtsY [Candidatus ainarchaeum sp.]MDD3084954.1 signal recognition particle-docking protein FtsY [Candidatus ainarchaeum sp.]MDD4221410.1 signal recognition particle-docking protein FtsY [Candidatus ainarchaeum sp.]MDD4662950.1 signal recognition particle-docking protein FtsY [Candidatus ainarchaeum sp.]